MPKVRSDQSRSTKASRCLFGRPDQVIKDALDQKVKRIIEEDTRRLVTDFGDFESVSAKNIPTFYKRVRGQRLYVDDENDELFPRVAKSPPLVSPTKPQDTILALADEIPSTSSKPAFAILPSPAKRPRAEKNVSLENRRATRSTGRLFQSSSLQQNAENGSTSVSKECGQKIAAMMGATKTRGKPQLQSYLTNYMQPERKRLTPQVKNEGKAAIKQIAIHRHRESSAPPSPMRFLIEETDGTRTKTYMGTRKGEDPLVDTSKKPEVLKGMLKSASTSRISHLGGRKMQ
ncbi:unnamed protein product, partial [Mesorhabditis belari]|uniref:Uncharacterized protein n=1 Tax=Mesorhabditis belari TaxID=2138241 RepID=A0AAF3J7Q0_9BILA